jgi:hypothetical protein
MQIMHNGPRAKVQGPKSKVRRRKAESRSLRDVGRLGFITLIGFDNCGFRFLKFAEALLLVLRQWFATELSEGT